MNCAKRLSEKPQFRDSIQTAYDRKTLKSKQKGTEFGIGFVKQDSRQWI